MVTLHEERLEHAPAVERRRFLGREFRPGAMKTAKGLVQPLAA